MKITVKGKTVDRVATFLGPFTVPGDKSISHRAVMLGALAEGVTVINGFLTGEDCLATIDCFRALGVIIEVCGTQVTITGRGMRGLQKPSEPLYVGNSGTSLRLMTGLLAAQGFDCALDGDASIRTRPMDRVIVPLRAMGARLHGTHRENRNGKPIETAPVYIHGGQNLQGMHYTMPVASAQVKSALLLASLYAADATVITEPTPSRDHTEIMLSHFGADITKSTSQIISRPIQNLHAQNITVPGDISSAAFIMAAAAITPGASVCIQNVGINETRTGFITALTAMGGDVRIQNKNTQCGEPVGDICVGYAPLKGVTVEGALIPAMIDEIPILAAVALYASGRTVIRDAAELKVKESDRIHAVVSEYQKLGAKITETADGMIIEGGMPLYGGIVESHNDHRLAMSLAIAALGAAGDTTIGGAECVDVSFPGFFDCISAWYA